MSTQCWPFYRLSPTRGMAAALLVLLVAVASAPSLTAAAYEAVDVHLSSNLCTRPHGELFGVLHHTLGLTLPIMTFAGHRFLSTKDVQQGSPPARTIKLHLSGCSAAESITLALSDGDASVLAFADGAGLWHAFPGFEFLFPNSITLPFNASYDDLIGGHQNLPTAVPLGRASALEAIRAVSRPGTAGTNKSALARLMVMTTESLRWKPIREAFSRRWESESFLTEEEAELVAVPHWVDLSYLVSRWEVTKAWGEGAAAKGLEKIGVYNVDQALSVADLLKRPKELMCKPIPPPGSTDLGEEYGEEGDGGGTAAAAALDHDL